jgi:cell division protein FtsI/penicillin-binding protein 2
MIGAVFDALATGQARWRRARNLRAGQARVRTPARADAPAPGRRGCAAERSPVAERSTDAARSLIAERRTDAARSPAAQRSLIALRLLGAACCLLAFGGALVIGVHARWIAAAGEAAAAGSAGPAGLAALQAVLPGASFTVPAGPAVALGQHGGASLLVLSGLRPEPARRVDLCGQMLDPGRGRLLPLRIGYSFAEVAALAARNAGSASPVALRNVMIAEEAMPRVQLSGSAAAPELRWNGYPARWVGDLDGANRLQPAAAAQTRLGRQGWLLWDDRALRFLRRPSAACASGELVLQLYRPGPGLQPGPRSGPQSVPQSGERALAIAFPPQGEPREAWLAPGSYAVPAAPAPAMEDQRLFEALRARGLLRLGADGLAELAPPDLAAWRSRGPTGWDGVAMDAEALRLLERLYRHADGDFVREQVRIFNSERRLLAWRLRAPEDDAGRWQAEAGDAPAPLARDLPAAATRLFARLPQGWGGWRRVAAWPLGGERARLRLQLPATAQDAGLQLMLVGRLLGVSGARLRSATPACSGRACAQAGQVQVLDLQPDPGAREVVLDAAPLGMEALASPGDARYRHLVLRNGALAWQPMPAGQGRRAGVQAEVALADRRGRSLWIAGAPTEAARTAGLAPLLGIQAGHANSVAGMLARLPGAGSHHAALTLDLDLQAQAQAALDCIAMRRGAWDGRRCTAGMAPPAGRQAGMVLLDAASGEVLAAAGAGAGKVDGANWREARDFDRIDPAASPLRLPAFQHDGGAERSPGSTFKIVSALGLELAARQDARLDALLEGAPLAEINAMAAARGYAFRTDASTYPLDGRARITNFRDQGLDRRAQDGRLGLQQAITYSLNTWFAWTGELSDRSLLGRPEGGAPDLQPLSASALDPVRPIVAMARRLGFGQALRLDGGLLPADYPWSAWDALQASPSGIDPVHTRHELRQMAIGLRMQATPLQMALVAASVGEGRVVGPRLLASLDGRPAAVSTGPALGVRLDRIRAGMKGVIDTGTAAGAFRGAELAPLRRGLFGKTGTAPVGDGDLATVWFTGWLEPGSLPGQKHRLAFAVFVSRSEETGGAHAAPVAAAVLRAMQDMKWTPSLE